jgi:hypothetical protein
MAQMNANADQATGPRVLRAYFGHHKCASKWIRAIVSRVVAEIGLPAFHVYDRLIPAAVGPLEAWGSSARSKRARFDREELRAHVDAARAAFVVCPTVDRLQAQVLRPVRAFHVIRDPRDLIVSGYFSHRVSHETDGLPRLQAHREALLAVPLNEGLLLEMEFSKVSLLQMGDWDYADPAVLELKMEDLTDRPYEGFIQIFHHLDLLTESDPVRAIHQARVWTRRVMNRLSHRRHFGGLARSIPATGELVLAAVYAERFEAQTGGRQRGVEDVASHYRKGVAGDWRNYFTPQHVDAFQAHYGDLLVRLGYEETENWGL